MILLDCESPELTSLSLEKILSLRWADICAFLSDIDGEGFDRQTDKNFGEYLLRLLMEKHGRREIKADRVCWFHATRTPDHTRFRNGLIPLGESVEMAWADLRQLVSGKVSDQKWQEFRHELENGTNRTQDADWYREKLESDHGGPWGFLVKASAFSCDDYLQVPEIVQQMCNCADDALKVDLLKCFQASSRPCIVKFWSDDTKDIEKLVAEALWYLWEYGHGNPYRGQYSFNGEGNAVSPERILNVECPVVPDPVK